MPNSRPLELSATKTGIGGAHRKAESESFASIYVVLHWDPFLSKPNGVPYLHDGWGRHGSGGRLLPLPAALPAPVPGEAGGGGWKKHRKLRRMKVEGGEWMVESGGRQG